MPLQLCCDVLLILCVFAVGNKINLFAMRRNSFKKPHERGGKSILQMMRLLFILTRGI